MLLTLRKRLKLVLNLEYLMVSDNPIHALAIGVEIWVYVYVRDSPHSSQISH